MKKLIIWLAKALKVDLTVEKIIYRDRVSYVEKQITLDGTVDGDVTLNGNLYVTGNIYVAGNISACDDIYCGMSPDEVKMKAGGDVLSKNK